MNTSVKWMGSGLIADELHGLAQKTIGQEFVNF